MIVASTLAPKGAEEFSPGLNGAKLRILWDDQLPGGVGELSSRFQPEKVRRDALLTSERRAILG
jgi:hypothetical protein